jgi:hypothetical protein
MAYDGQARDLAGVNPVELGERDEQLAAIVECAQSEAFFCLCKEAHGGEVYEVRVLRRQLFLRSEWARVWLTASAKVVTCFAVQISRTGGEPWENPMDWIA